MVGHGLAGHLGSVGFSCGARKLGESVGVPNTVAAVPITAPGALAKKALVDRIM